MFLHLKVMHRLAAARLSPGIDHALFTKDSETNAMCLPSVQKKQEINHKTRFLFYVPVDGKRKSGV